MSKSQRLRIGDVVAAFRLLGECRDLGADARAWRSHCVTEMARRIGAQVGVSVEVMDYAAERPRVFGPLSVGWADRRGQELWQRFVEYEKPECDPCYRQLALLLRKRNGLFTRSRQQLVSDRDWYRSRFFNEYPRLGGTDHCLYSYQVIEVNRGPSLDVIEFHRPAGADPFVERERQLVRLLHREIAALLGRQLASWREPGPATLPPRLRQTLELLLAGASEKEIAHRLNLSRATVHEYVTSLLRRFDVHSRAELQARWRSWGRIDT